MRINFYRKLRSAFNIIFSLIWLLLFECVMICAAVILLVVWMFVAILLACNNFFYYCFNKIRGKTIGPLVSAGKKKNDTPFYNFIFQKEYFCKN